MRDLFRGLMSYRRLWVLITQLPQESLTQTALRDSRTDDELQAAAAASGEQKFGPWRLDNYQLAALTDAVRRVEFVLGAVNGNEWEPPEPTPTPDRPAPRKPVMSSAQVTYLSNLRAKGA